MGERTARGEAVAAGYSALADENGDDTLTVPDDQSDARGDSPDVETEEDPAAGADTVSDAPAPGPADIPSPPSLTDGVETADENVTDKENRSS